MVYIKKFLIVFVFGLVLFIVSCGNQSPENPNVEDFVKNIAGKAADVTAADLNTGFNSSAFVSDAEFNINSAGNISIEGGLIGKLYVSSASSSTEAVYYTGSTVRIDNVSDPLYKVPTLLNLEFDSTNNQLIIKSKDGTTLLTLSLFIRP